MQVANPFDFPDPPCPTRVRNFGGAQSVSWEQRGSIPKMPREVSRRTWTAVRNLSDRPRLVAVARIWRASVGGRRYLTLPGSSGGCPVYLGT